MKHILMITYRFDPTFSGATLQAFSLAGQLRKKGVSVEFLASNSFNNAIWRKVTKDGFCVHTLRGSNLIFAVLFGLFLIARHKKFSHIHFHGFFPGHYLCVLLAKIIAGVPVVQKMTKGDAKTCELPLKGRFHRVRRKALGLIDKFIAISSDINQALLSNGIPKEKIVQVPNGVDIHLFHPTDSCAKQEPSLTGPIDDGVVLLYVGSIDRRKNVNLLIDCFRKFLTMLDTERRKYKFVIAGPILDLAYYNEIQEYIQKHSLSSCVCFVGLLEQKEIVSLYSRATLFVFAGSNEGLPNAVIEAKAAGLPVVAFDTYGVRDVIRDGVDGHLVLFGETKQFAEKIKSVLLDQARLKRMSLLALNDVQQRYAFESIVDRYLDDVYISGSISFFPLLYRGNPSRR